MLKYYDEVGVANWASGIRKLLCENGFGYKWDRQRVENEFLCLYRGYKTNIYKTGMNK